MSAPTDLPANVRAFHALVNVACPEAPAIGPDDGVRLRARLITEEFFEVMRSLFGIQFSLDDAEEFVMRAIRQSAPRVDLPNAAKELADLAYVIEGSFLSFGISSPPVHALVHATNMTKRGGPVVDGKACKPEGWEAPDVGAELRRQGWMAGEGVSK